MANSAGIIWFEWFNTKKQIEFEEETKKIWGLALRNEIATTVFKKWLRENLCQEINDTEVDKEQIINIENRWANQKNIDSEKFKNHREEILEKCQMSEENFRVYCLNELKSVKWSEKTWNSSIEQIYLETKEDYDEIKLKMITMPVKEKGLALEVYQQLKEGETDFSEIINISSAIKYQSKPEGSWYKKTSLRREIKQRSNKLNNGQLSLPFKIGEFYTIVQFCESRGAELTSDIRKKILSEQMNQFIDYGVKQLIDYATK